MSDIPENYKEYDLPGTDLYCVIGPDIEGLTFVLVGGPANPSWMPCIDGEEMKHLVDSDLFHVSLRKFNGIRNFRST